MLIRERILGKIYVRSGGQKWAGKCGIAGWKIGPPGSACADPHMLIGELCRLVVTSDIIRGAKAAHGSLATATDHQSMAMFKSAWAKRTCVREPLGSKTFYQLMAKRFSKRDAGYVGIGLVDVSKSLDPGF